MRERNEQCIKISCALLDEQLFYRAIYDQITIDFQLEFISDLCTSINTISFLR